LFLLFIRQHIIDETGDHFLIVESNAKSLSNKALSKMEMQHKRTIHRMTEKGKYHSNEV